MRLILQLFIVPVADVAGALAEVDEDADGDWAYIDDCKNAILVYYVVLDYIQQTGSPPGNNEYWWNRFNDALDA